MSDLLRILVVDDEAVDRAAVGRALTDSGINCEVREASTGQETIGLLAAERFDCVLMDSTLPDKSGTQLLEELRSAGVCVPVVMMAGQANEPLAVELMKAGAADYIAKAHVSTEQLARCVRGAVRVHRAEEQCRFLAEAIPQIVFTTRPDGTTDFVNRNWTDYSGQSLENGQGYGWQQAVHPDDLASAGESWTRSIQTGEPHEHQTRFRRAADGAYRWHLVRALPMRDARGRIVKWIGTCTDLHDLRSTQDALREAKEAAESANNAKDQFLAVLSHELRTPLTPVLSTVQSLELDQKLCPELRDSLEVIRRNVELEARLIDDLLDLTRISKGKLQLNFETVDLHEVVRNAMDICASEIADRQVGMTMDLSASRHHVRGDPARLQQVFWNLIKNAIKFTPQHGHITIHSFDDPSGAAKVAVIDTGIGIEGSALARIFDAFEQGDRAGSRQFGGLGLGLAISKALVALHGGKLAADSAGTGQGATFTVELRPTAARAEPSENDDFPAAQLESARGVHILLVDDHQDTNRAMAQLLERMGYAVQTADCVQAALHAANETQFDLLISDIGLPDGSGLELMRQLLQRQSIKGIALSGFGMEEDVVRSREAGFYEHLTKPINFKRLESAIRELTLSPSPLVGEGRTSASSVELGEG